MKKYDIEHYNELAEYLKKEGKLICEMNECTEYDHNCESYAYINKDGDLLDLCGSDYFRGSPNPVAAISVHRDFIMTGKELREEIAEQTFDIYTELED